jgi:hypothetical protein
MGLALVVFVEPSGKCFDHGCKVRPLAASINDGGQEGIGCGPDAHANSGLFGQVDGEADVLTGQCRREPTWMRRIEQAVQPESAGETDHRTVGNERPEEFVGDCLLSGRGDGLGK